MTPPEAGTALEALGWPWGVVLDEAWASWRDGNIGIGAALVDPRAGGDERLVSVGRNRVTDPPLPGLLTGNFAAHAEMNAFAALPLFNAMGLHLYTSLEPCLMCASTSILMGVEHVYFAASDEFMAGIHELWRHHPYTAANAPSRTGPVGQPIASFCRLLPLTFLVVWAPNDDVMAHADERVPELARLARSVMEDETLADVKARNGSVVDAIGSIWDRLVALPS